MKTWTVLDLVEWTEDYFRESGITTPRLDAEVLLGFVLQKSRLQLYLSFEMPVFPDHLSVFRQLVQRRKEHTPVSYLTNHREFMSIDFYVDSRVLIPRPETEILVEYVLDRTRTHGPISLADIGTGSGAIAVSLAFNRPEWYIVATDISIDALAVAKTNATRHQTQIEFRSGDMLSTLESVDNKFDWIVSNPPYISSQDYKILPPDVRNFEPKLALASPPDGLQLIRILIESAPNYLKPNGRLAIEIGKGQRLDVEDFVHRSKKYQKIDFIPDLSGVARILVVQV
ncbi:protein-(glutamine-N5) methyltransferase, release factor-specific [Candidatus Poribacteria bacterium]|nr:protein-(glutamine-N5) methyltransferase, release factor-specific [Candidatus Poribacteria bacterium]OUT59302.1 MAG: protein-(glutamine-N5) methyltransferase, release factor-specific [bacterium TMED15]